MQNTTFDKPLNGKQRARQERDKEFLDMFGDVLRLMLDRKMPHPLKSAVLFTLHNGTPHYHVSFDRAYIVTNIVLRTGEPPVKNPVQRALWLEIAQRVQQLVAMSGGGLSVAKALEYVLLNCRATRFYMSEKWALRHIHTMRAEKRQRLSQRWNAARH
ncbi:MAG: hypothetical protein II609_03010 [Muribaculaceae bacterium]|jgi:hypothetical protein|nr:hypothetical protein [Muribaculaceae bacterium]